MGERLRDAAVQPREHRVHLLQQADEGRADLSSSRRRRRRRQEQREANLGAVQNTGFEALDQRPVRRPPRFGWDVTFAASHNSNKLKSLGVDPAGNPIKPIVNTTHARLGRGLSR